MVGHRVGGQFGVRRQVGSEDVDVVSDDVALGTPVQHATAAPAGVVIVVILVAAGLSIIG